MSIETIIEGVTVASLCANGGLFLKLLSCKNDIRRLKAENLKLAPENQKLVAENARLIVENQKKPLVTFVNGDVGKI